MTLTRTILSGIALGVGLVIGGVVTAFAIGEAFIRFDRWHSARYPPHYDTYDRHDTDDSNDSADSNDSNVTDDTDGLFRSPGGDGSDDRPDESDVDYEFIGPDNPAKGTEKWYEIKAAEVIDNNPVLVKEAEKGNTTNLLVLRDKLSEETDLGDSQARYFIELALESKRQDDTPADPSGAGEAGDCE